MDLFSGILVCKPPKYFRLFIAALSFTTTVFVVIISFGSINTDFPWHAHNIISPMSSIHQFNSTADNLNVNSDRFYQSECPPNSDSDSSACNRSLFVNKTITIRNQLERILESYIKEDNSRIAKPPSVIDLKSYTKEKQFFKRENSVNVINCSSVFNGNETEIRRAEKISEWFSKNVITPLEYINMTRNCQRFIKERGYVTDSLTEEEKNFPIAFSILMFKAVEQFERLLRSIYRPQNTYCIHVDAKSNSDLFQAVSGIARCFDNVFTSRRVDVIWGNFSVLAPEFVCMQELIKNGKLWKYFINLTGQEFPLKTHAELVKILKAYNGSNDIDAYITRDSEYLARITDAGQPPHRVVPMKGIVHVAVTRDFVKYVLYNQTAHDILNWASYTHHPDETYFATLHGNTFLNVPGGKTGKNSGETRPAARYKTWSGGTICRGVFRKHICVFGIGDLQKMSTRFELFVNKFRMNFHPLAYDCMEEIHFNRTRDQYLNILSFNATCYRDGGYSCTSND